MKDLIRNAALRLTSKRVDKATLHPVHIPLTLSEVTAFNLSTNRILSFKRQGKTYYFRECPPLLPKSDFFCRSAENFFTSLAMGSFDKSVFGQNVPIPIEFSADTVAAFKAYIFKKLGEKAFLSTLAKADKIAIGIGFSIWSGKVDANAVINGFGLTDLPDGLADAAVYFLWCMRSAASDYRRRNVAKGNGHALFGAVRSVASRILAEELRLADLVTDTEWCVLEINGHNPLFGVLSPAAMGVRMADCAAVDLGSLQKELNALNVLDVLAFQPDHGPNNYNVYSRADGKNGVCAFDNDNPRTFFTGFTVSSALSGCSPLIGGDGKVNRPYMDRALADRLKNTDKAVLKRKLSPYLNFLQIRAIIKRLEKLNKAIEQSQQLTFLDECGQWNDNTARQEISGAYGTTYLCKALKK